jgi:plasmid maintenance system antidote protein VapI
VGESSFILRRLKQHIRTQYSDSLICNKHLVNSIRKHGINSFKIFIVCEESNDYERVLIENRLINMYRDFLGYNNVYNVRNKSDSNLGVNVGDAHHLSIKSDIKKNIIYDYSTGEYLIIELCNKYNISHNTIKKIIGNTNKSIVSKRMSGEKNNSAKITSDIAIQILKYFFYDKNKINFISKKYGINRGVVQNVINNLTYIDVELDNELANLRHNYSSLSTKDKKSYNSMKDKKPQQ